MGFYHVSGNVVSAFQTFNAGQMYYLSLLHCAFCVAPVKKSLPKERLKENFNRFPYYLCETIYERNKSLVTQ